MAVLAAAAPAAVMAAGSKASAFSKGFLWGAATAGHQIEGNDVNSDFWLLEKVKPTIFSEPVGDACNSIELWRVDLDLARTIGLNSYRFSLEWSRIEPEPGQFSVAILDHYAAVIDGCRARGLNPVVTFSHWTVPRWFAARGGWTNPESPAMFARFCDRAARQLAAGIGHAATLNEANGLRIGQRMVPQQAIDAQVPMLAAAAKAVGSDRFVGGPSFGFIDAMTPNMVKAHTLGRQAIKAARSDLPVGVTLAVLDDQAAGQDTTMRDRMRADFYGPWIEAVKGDDFVGVQNYGRAVWANDPHPLPPPAGVPVNSEGMEIYPASLAGAVRYIHQATGRPILVTEHGVYSEDDRQRVSLIPAALRELKRAMDDGVPVLGYIHWSLIDNFEWTSGYNPKLGLASVDRRTFRRTLKPSATVYGAIARRNGI